MTRMRPFVSESSKTTPWRSSLCAAALALVLVQGACDSGTQEPEAPTPDAPAAATDAGAAPDPSSTPAPDAPAAVAREGAIDSARFPSELPEGVSAAVPENFPADVPLYPGAQPAQGKGVDLEGKPQAAVQLLTNDAMPDVHKFYSERLQAEGWTLSEDQSTDSAAAIQATKNDCNANILVTPVEGGGSDIFIVTGC